MKSTLRSCLRWIALYVVIAAALAALVYIRFPMPSVAIGTGAAAAIPAWFGVAYIVHAIFGKGGDAALIREATAGGRPEDGEKVAVAGTVSSGFESLETPVSRRRAVLYEYKVLPYGREQAGVYEGFAMVPMTIEGPRGSIRVLAAPDLDFTFDRLNDAEHRRKLDEYIARTPWTDHKGVDIQRELAHLKNVMADDDGRIRFDIRRDMPPGADLSRMEIREKVISPGEKIVAIGRYSSSRGGLVPQGGGEITPSLKIMKGDADEVLRSAKRGAVGHVVLGCGCLTPVLVAAIAALALIPLEAIEEMRPAKDPSWTEVRAERWIDEKVRKRFAALRPEGEVAILLDSGQARGRLDDARLTRAFARHTGDAIDLTLDSGNPSEGVAIRFRGGAVESAAVIHGPVIPPGEIEIRQLREEDEHITGRVTWLSAAHNLRAAFRARKER